MEYPDPRQRGPLSECDTGNRNSGASSLPKDPGSVSSHVRNADGGGGPEATRCVYHPTGGVRYRHRKSGSTEVASHPWLATPDETLSTVRPPPTEVMEGVVDPGESITIPTGDFVVGRRNTGPGQGVGVAGGPPLPRSDGDHICLDPGTSQGRYLPVFGDSNVTPGRIQTSGRLGHQFLGWGHGQSRH